MLQGRDAWLLRRQLQKRSDDSYLESWEVEEMFRASISLPDSHKAICRSHAFVRLCDQESCGGKRRNQDDVWRTFQAMVSRGKLVSMSLFSSPIFSEFLPRVEQEWLAGTHNARRSCSHTISLRVGPLLKLVSLEQLDLVGSICQKDHCSANSQRYPYHWYPISSCEGSDWWYAWLRLDRVHSDDNVGDGGLRFCAAEKQWCFSKENHLSPMRESIGSSKQTFQIKVGSLGETNARTTS